jgi:energy-converting hydrogenase Eha subunit F
MNADNSMRNMKSIISNPDTDHSMYGSENITIAGAMIANFPGKICDEILYVRNTFKTEITSPVYLAAASSGKLIVPHNER